jgi:hypothetical protein
LIWNIDDSSIGAGRIGLAVWDEPHPVHVHFDNVIVRRTFDLHFTSSFHVAGAATSETYGIMVTVDNLASSYDTITVTDVAIHGVTPRDADCQLLGDGIGTGINIPLDGTGSFYVCLDPTLWKDKMANVHLWVYFTTNMGTHHIGVNVMFRA